MIYTQDHIDCYSDGTLGDTHLRVNLANMMRGHLQGHIAQDVESSIPEIQDDGTRDALNYLNEISAEDVEWVLDSGDLLLVKADGSFHEFGV